MRYLEEDNNSSPDISALERAWLERAAGSMAVETVVKQGEMLYIPDVWFHYVTSLQKSCQCNGRSGLDPGPHEEFGGHAEIEQCMD